MKRTENLHASDNRVMDERLSNENLKKYREKSMQMTHQASTYIDPQNVPYGYVYCWTRESLFGEHDPRRVADAENQNWTKVPPARHPEVRSERAHDIYIKGAVLMERPVEYDQIDEEVRYLKTSKVANFLAYMQTPFEQKELARSVYNPNQINTLFPQHLLNSTSFSQEGGMPNLNSIHNRSISHNHFMSFGS